MNIQTFEILMAEDLNSNIIKSKFQEISCSSLNRGVNSKSAKNRTYVRLVERLSILTRRDECTEITDDNILIAL